MPKVLLLLTFSLAALLGPARPAQAGWLKLCQKFLRPAAATSPYTEAQIADLVKDIEAHWAAEFAGRGWFFAGAGLVLYDGQIKTGCGVLYRAHGPGYCNVDGTLYLDPMFFRENEAYLGRPTPTLLAYALAHEYGHHVQSLRDALTASGFYAALREKSGRVGELLPKVEFQADCLAGVYMASRYKRGLAGTADLIDGVLLAQLLGDDMQEALFAQEGKAIAPLSGHGRGAERAQWFSRGMRAAKPEACEPFPENVLSRGPPSGPNP